MTELLRFSFGAINAGRAPSVPFGGASPRSILGLEISTPGVALVPPPLAMFGTGHGRLLEFGPNTLHDFGSI